jgi:hypothetical protein
MKHLSPFTALCLGVLTSTLMSLVPTIAPLAILTTLTLTASPAEACRDCPFPMRIGDNRWLMPDESFVITIVEKEISESSFSVMVRLTDPVTGRILASGGTQRRRDQHSITVPMRDRLGGKVVGTIIWVDPAHTKIRVRFQCSSGYDCLQP